MSRKTQTGNEIGRRLVTLLLSARTTAFRFSLMSSAERAACARTIDPDCVPLLGPEVRQPPAPPPSPSLLALAVRLWAAAGLPGATPTLESLSEAIATTAFRQGWGMARPAEYLLTTGGDNRLRLDPETGLNRYGCSPRPRPAAITFASTTATSVSEGAFHHVEALRFRLMRAALAESLPEAYDQAMAETLALVGLGTGASEVAGSEVILTPSGTDAEFYALHLALAADSRPLTNIVIAPRETGGSVLPAAAGRHYDTLTALGHSVEIGVPIDPVTSARVAVSGIAIRDEAGRLLPSAVVNAEVTRQVREALGTGRRVLLHLLDTSKTGLIAPSVACVVELARQFGDGIDVVVDASQFRLCRETVAGYLALGFMVIVTGSKFFTGPPFAGALLVPPGIGARALAGASALPAGMAGYTNRQSWPDAWGKFCRRLGDEITLGPLMRWWAALWEMEAFESAGRDGRAEACLGQFLDAVREAVEASPCLRRFAVPAPDRSPLGRSRGWDALPTILTFAVLRKRGGALDLPALHRLYGALNRDVSADIPGDVTAAERKLAAVCCHIGQPVSLGGLGGEEVGGLRLSAGARVVSGGDVEREIVEARLVLDKIALLVRHQFS
ncbi:MAG: hypothetical protein ABT940_01440 [Alphaproteobacteria bacterium]